MNELVIFNYSVIRSLNSSFKCYELAVRERAKAHVLESMRNNLRQLPALTFSRTLAGILRGWDLTIERNEELHF